MTSHLGLSTEHHEYLNSQAISDESMVGCYTAVSVDDLPPDVPWSAAVPTPGIVFRLEGYDGTVSWQLRPDDPRAERKYEFPSGSRSMLSVPPGERPVLEDQTAPILIVEGTKQQLAAASATCRMTTGRPAVLGIAGCWGWSVDGGACGDVYAVPFAGRHVLIAFDADIASNRNVWEAASRLSKHLQLISGAATVKFIVLPGEKQGLDDVLARTPEDGRPELMARLITTAEAKLPRKPPPSNALVDRGGLKTDKAWKKLEARHPMAVTAENSIAVYSGGVYRNGDSLQFEASVNRLLGDDFRDMHLRTLVSYGIAELRNSGRVIDDDTGGELVVNFRNGLLDLETMTLYEHTPDFRSLVQFAVDWDPEGTCPTYDAWLAERTDQADNLHEVLGQMFLPGTPQKAGFLYGPPRSGKSTLLRLAARVAGLANTSAVSLHQLSDDRFAAANVYGKVLNVAADLPSRDVSDLSTFKLMTGEDPINADRKFGNQFVFTNRALFLFSANEVPTIGEGSAAYLARMVPVAFPATFVDMVDATYDERLAAELPGIVRHWVAGAQRVARGLWSPVPHAIEAAFANASDAVRAFLDECTELVTQARLGSTPTQLHQAFGRWSQDNRRSQGLSRNKFSGRLSAAGVESREYQGSKRYMVRLREGGGAAVIALTAGAEGAATLHSPPGTTADEDLEGSREGQVDNCGTYGTHPAPGHTGRPAAPVPFDLETGSVSDLHRADLGYDYVRLCGLRPDPDTSVEVHCDPRIVLDLIDRGVPVAAHNGFGFDFLGLARHHGLDLLAASEAGLLVDTKVLAFLGDPPEARQKALEHHYGLNAVAARLGHPGKCDDIKELAKKHGGFERIPLDDPDYRAYVQGDVEAMIPILDAYPLTEYARREFRILGRLVTGISLSGWRVDETLLAERVAAGEAVVAERTAWLRDAYGLPTARKDGTPSKRPHATQAGREAIAAAFASRGLELPRSEAGNPSLGKDFMLQLREELVADGGHPELLDLVDTVLALNGVRTVYGSVLHWTIDGRTHSRVDARQASGRISVVDPGLTVMGKRDGRWHEREVFLPDEGDLLVAFDLDQIDARAIAGHAQDSAYMAMFAPGMDVHAEVAQRVFGDESRREEAKAIGHGWNYGMSIDGIARQAGVDVAVAMRFDSSMREQFPRLVKWRDDIRDAAATGVLIDNGFGRLMRPTPGREHTQAPALVGQGCARDLMMEGVLALPLDLVPRLRAVVHDELVFSLPADAVQDASALIVAALSFEWRGVRITAGASRTGRTWGDCYRKESE